MAAAPLPPAPVSSFNPTNAPLSQGARIINTFIAPTKTFTDLRRSASWWLPFLISAIVTVAFVYVVDKKVGFRRVMENQIQMSAKATQRMEQLPSEQRETQINMQAKGTRYFSYGFWLFGLLWNLIIAAVLFATFKLGASADLTFKRTFAVIMYASLPGVFKALLGILSLVAGVSADSFTFQNPVATNPGYFLNPADSHFLYGIATSIDVFMIWVLILTAIGLSSVSKLKRSTAMIGVFGWYILFTVVASGIGAAFS